MVDLIHQRRISMFYRGRDKTVCGVYVTKGVLALKYPGPKELTCPECLKLVHEEKSRSLQDSSPG